MGILGKKAVPPFQQYFPSVNHMNPVQRRFYERWVKSWKQGKALNVDGQISYLFCYIYSILCMPPKQCCHELKRIMESYPKEDKMVDYCRQWLSDCYVLMGRYKSAVAVFPLLLPSSRSSSATDSLLTLKLHAGYTIAGRDVLTLYGPKVTQFGRDYLEEVAHYLEVFLRAYERDQRTHLLKEWARNTYRHPYFVFGGSPSATSIDLEAYAFSLNKEVEEFIEKITSEAENTVREEHGIPKIGESWVGETKLLYEIKRAFADYEVIHHARPKWLGQQHLDIFIPSLSVAIEYQGIQHDQPVAYFGGNQACEQQQRRDSRKRRRCTQKGIRPIFIRPGYVLADVIKQIREINKGKQKENRASLREESQ